MPTGCLDVEHLDRVVSFLNELAALDGEAIEHLVEMRAQCNRALLEHPTVQATEDDEGNPVVGLLGVINGMFGTQPEGSIKPGSGFVAAQFDSRTGRLTGFIRVDK